MNINYNYAAYTDFSYDMHMYPSGNEYFQNFRET